MTYFVDERDVHFNLFEYLDMDQLGKLPRFEGQNSDTYKMVLSEALKFSQNEIDPLSAKGDKQGCKLEAGQVIVPQGYKEAYQAFAQNGFLGIDVSPELGGSGLPSSLLVACFEYFTGANVAFSMYAGLTRGAAHVIETFGGDQLAHLFCTRMYSGQWAGTMCLTEPQAGSSVGDIKTTATPNSDGTFSIRGNKIFISSGDHQLTENIIHLVLARVEGDAPGTRGISLFVVPKIWVLDDGSLAQPNDVTSVNVEHKMGIKAQATLSLNFGEQGGCRGYLIGERSQGMKYMFQLMNEARLLTGLQGCALAASAYEHARRYAAERIQGEGKAIIEYPDVRRNLALCKAWVEGIRALIYKTAVSHDLSRYLEDGDPKEKLKDATDLAVPVCKAYGTDFGFKVTELAMQVYGGYGYISEYPIEQYMRDAKIGSIYEGTNGIQSMDLMGRKLPQKGGQLFRTFYEESTALANQLGAIDSLKNAADLFQKAINSIGQVVLKMAELGMSGNREIPLLSATPFLEMCGHAMVARCLLEQGLIAHKKITEGSTDRFYVNKIKTATFFCIHILPLVQARAKALLSLDRTAMEIEF